MKAMSRDVLALAHVLWRDLNTPLTLKMKILADYGEWDQLASIRIDPSCYLDSPFGAFRLFCDYQGVSFLRKFPGLPLQDVNPREVAMKGFWLSEAQCFRTNQRLRRYRLDPVYLDNDEWIEPVIRRARNFLRRVMGSLPRQLEPRFGPGATFESKNEGVRPSELTVLDKLEHKPTATVCARPLVDHYLWPSAFGRVCGKLYPDRTIDLVSGNRFTTVPKDATKDRGICIEPGLNVWLQLGVGSVLKRRLLRVGLDLANGQTLHRRLASEASLSGKYATIDLSNASDTVSLELVKLLLPDDWYALLADLRSPKTFIDGKWVLLEKFSSMGNGFTFELETLIFAALLASIGLQPGVDSYVYGDDIIVPNSRAADVLAVLRFFGFTPNPSKTFSTGAFRESCGGDFFSGFWVTPFYLKKEPSQPSDWISVANALFRLGSSGFSRFASARYLCIGHIPSDVRKCKGPSRLGDLVIHCHPREWTLWYEASQCWFKAFVPLFRHVNPRRYDPLTQLAAALMGVPPEGPVPRGGTAGYRIKWVVSS